MKVQRSVFVFALVVFLLGAAACKQHGEPAKSSAPNPSESAAAFLGRWDLTLRTPYREYPSWLELTQVDGQLKAQMVGRWGNARPLPNVEITNGRLRFVSPKEEEDRKDDMVFEGILNDDSLAGNTTGPDGEVWSWTGVRAPSLQENGTPKWGRPIALFNGKDLSGWSMSKSDAKTVWKVEKGKLISPGNGPELISDAKFKDFKITRGIQLRARIEQRRLSARPLRSADRNRFGWRASQPSHGSCVRVPDSVTRTSA